MKADDINSTIDDVSEYGEQALKKLITNKALVIILGANTGFLSIVLSSLISKLLDVAVFPVLRDIKRQGQFQVDVQEGKLLLKKIDKAIEEQNESEIIDSITQL